MLNKNRLSQTFIDLCRIPSPSGQEGRVAAYVRQRVTAMGLTIDEDDAAAALNGEVGNLFVRCPGMQGEPLLLTAHMDTVLVPFEDEIPVIVDGDRVHTGGRSPLGGDDKAGVAIALELLANAVAAPDQACPLEVIFTVQEEQGTRGASHFDTRQLTAKQGLVLDGDTPVGTTIRESVFKVRYEIKIHGRKAHAAVNPEDGINAIQVLGAIAAVLPTGRLDESSVANLGYIEGGGVINAVPDRARLVGELRSLRLDRVRDIEQQIKHIVQREAAARGATADLDFKKLYSGYFVSDNALCAQLFAQACRAEGFEPTFHTTLGGGDANPLNNKGLTCIVVGLGMEAIHTHEEFMLLSRLEQAARIVHRIVGLPV